MSHPAFDQDWDVVIIGTGIGGGTAGRALAEAGLRVLFLEQGAEGFRREETPLDMSTPHRAARLARGAFPDPMRLTLNGRSEQRFPYAGSGVGGSSAYYAAALERPAPHDLDDGATRPHPTGGWPVSFAVFEPYFSRAATLYRLSGTDDPLSQAERLPLRTPPEMSRGEASLLADLERAGLHPYRLNTAIEGGPDCRFCIGHKCPRPCKMDGRSAGVEPALATGRAACVTGAEVLHLETDGARITALTLRHEGQVHRLTPPRVVLAGGAFASPRLLLASRSEAAPTGIGNARDQVGRHLMFHLNEMIALWPRRHASGDGPARSLAFRDLYHDPEDRFGLVQSMGLRADYGQILQYLDQVLERQGLGRFRRLTRPVAALGAWALGRGYIFVGLLEDPGLPENRVRFDPKEPEALVVDYTMSEALLARRKAFRRALKKRLRGTRRLLLSPAPELNYGHACGTLRFGSDPATSALTPECRPHGIDNLWVSDASFMPSAMGVNPSLTIAANALRVADLILEDRR
ncbi:6'''-hydroxyparomomycin C oxidase [Roseivivax sp. THAF40]|uniref:GMC oxidoreductase n=1 Tax=Roseivivax sp. THAF40 TaxID=2587858 RepID=UPI001269801C|nr:GMC family oxidoreductase [Roseivivax sp. THAF40]QFT48410.1 6'''-hydroxyparomomycin C oxidase [Roseivivax sp. THAF40]